MKLQNAKSKKIKDLTSGLPDVSLAVDFFLQPMEVEIVCKKNEDGYVTETSRCIKIRACRQPFTSQQLVMKVEGERSWKWHTLHTENNVNLLTDDIVKIKGTSYRVMSKYDYSEYGYYQYEVVEDYRDAE